MQFARRMGETSTFFVLNMNRLFLYFNRVSGDYMHLWNIALDSIAHRSRVGIAAHLRKHLVYYFRHSQYPNSLYPLVHIAYCPQGTPKDCHRHLQNTFLKICPLINCFNHTWIRGGGMPG